MKLHLPRGLRTALLACLNVTFASLAAMGGMAYAEPTETLIEPAYDGATSAKAYFSKSGETYTSLITASNNSIKYDDLGNDLNFALTFSIDVTSETENNATICAGGSNVASGLSVLTASGNTLTLGNAQTALEHVKDKTGADATSGLAIDATHTYMLVFARYDGEGIVSTTGSSNIAYLFDLSAKDYVYAEGLSGLTASLTSGTSKVWTNGAKQHVYLGNVYDIAGMKKTDLVNKIISTDAYYYKGSGDWNLTGNDWAFSDTGTASEKFVNGKDAHFTEAGGGGTIAIQDAITAQNIAVEGKIPYTFELGSGSLTVSDSVNVGNSATAIFNMDLSVKAVTVDQAGQLVMGDSKTLTTDSITLHQQSVLSGPGVFKPAAVILDVPEGADKTLQPVVKGGAVLDTPSITGTGVLHVKGSTLRASQKTEVSEVELQSEGTTVARLEILEGKTMTVNRMAIEDTVVDNNGELLITSGLIVKSKEGVDMGVLNVNGLMQVDGASTVVMHEGSIGMLALTSDDTNLICKTDLSLGSTTKDTGNLQVDGGLTVTGGVTLGKVDAGSLTIADSPSAALTVSGQLTAGSITLQHLTTTTPCLTAGSLGTGTTTFVVAPKVL